jgi:DNA-binding NarL/FixJ family response regulator
VIHVFVLAEVRFYEEGLAHVLDADPRFRVVGTARGIRPALARIADLDAKPEVVLVDVAMPDSAATVASLRRELPSARVIALAVREVEAEVLAWAEAGVDGLIEQSASLELLMGSIVRVAGGESVCSPRMTTTLLRRVSDAARSSQPSASAVDGLTSREQEIVGLMTRGLSYTEIATDLRIGLSTVKNHVHNILEKLQVRRRAEVAAVVENRAERSTR